MFASSIQIYSYFLMCCVAMIIINLRICCYFFPYIRQCHLLHSYLSLQYIPWYVYLVIAVIAYLQDLEIYGYSIFLLAQFQTRRHRISCRLLEQCLKKFCPEKNWVVMPYIFQTLTQSNIRVTIWMVEYLNQADHRLM